jgi:hypothetical protein
VAFCRDAPISLRVVAVALFRTYPRDRYHRTSAFRKPSTCYNLAHFRFSVPSSRSWIQRKRHYSTPRSYLYLSEGVAIRKAQPGVLHGLLQPDVKLGFVLSTLWVRREAVQCILFQGKCHQIEVHVGMPIAAPAGSSLPYHHLLSQYRYLARSTATATAAHRPSQCPTRPSHMGIFDSKLYHVYSFHSRCSSISCTTAVPEGVLYICWRPRT